MKKAIQLAEMSRQRFGPGGVDLDVIRDTDGEVWITAEQLGEALGYSNPRKAASNLINRHLEDFAGLTTRLKLRTPVGAQEVTAINHDGMVVAACLARTERGLQFRRWVCKVVRELKAGGKLITAEQSRQLARSLQQFESRIVAKLDQVHAEARERDAALLGTFQQLNEGVRSWAHANSYVANEVKKLGGVIKGATKGSKLSDAPIPGVPKDLRPLRRTKNGIARRKAICKKLRAEGFTIRAIAEALQVGHNTVWKDVTDFVRPSRAKPKLAQ